MKSKKNEKKIPIEIAKCVGSYILCMVCLYNKMKNNKKKNKIINKPEMINKINWN